MADNNGMIEETIQSHIRRDDAFSLDVIPFLIKAGEIISPYWSRQRDIELSRFWVQSDHVAAALSMFVSKVASIPLQIEPRDTSIKSHVRQADFYNQLLIDGSDFFQGWHASLAPRLVMSVITQDNGGFVEVIGDGTDKNKPREGPPLGLALLDPQRCQRTSNPVHPVLYQDTDGKLYRLHHSRIIETSSMPSYLNRLNGVGFCALSRMINTAQNLIDIGVYEQEKLGSRPARQLLIGRGLSAEEIFMAFHTAEQQMDSQGLSRFSKNVVIAKQHLSREMEFGLEKIDLNSVPDGFDKQMSVTIGMFLIALALNIPPRWLWPATSTGATKADAMFQHVAGLGGGVGHLLMNLKAMLGGDALSGALGKPVPPHLKIVFDFQDDEQDRQQAEIRGKRSETLERDINDGLLDLRTARSRALDAGDITDEQFAEMELVEGRLPDGQDVINLFLSPDPELQTLLRLSVPDVLNVEANDKEFVLDQVDGQLIRVRAELINPSRPAIFKKAQQAFMALVKLRELYEDEGEVEEPVMVMPPEMGAEEPAEGSENDNQIVPEPDQAATP